MKIPRKNFLEKGLIKKNPQKKSLERQKTCEAARKSVPKEKEML